ncbi:MAG: presenilin family intramembrane aspartyl protease PSH [Thermoplasmatota archaeon]
MMTESSEKDFMQLAPVVIMGLFFVLIYGLALLILHPFETAGIQPAFENPDDPVNIIYIFVIMLVFTGVVLLIAKFWKKQLIQFIILGAIGYTAFYAFFLPAISLLLPNVNAWIVLGISIAAAVFLVFMLYKYPEWYVIDLCGIIVGTSAIIVFGISLAIWLIIILLAGLAVYDAISVYKTKHMIDLADTVMDLKLPVLLVVPKIRNYSLIKETKRLKEQIESDEEREAFFMGLGDIVMPGILVVAVYYTVPTALSVVVGTIIGTLLGFSLLMRFVLKGNPQAGLPLLCGGAILGYIVSSLLFFGHLVGFGVSF